MMNFVKRIETSMRRAIRHHVKHHNHHHRNHIISENTIIFFFSFDLELIKIIKIFPFCFTVKALHQLDHRLHRLDLIVQHLRVIVDAMFDLEPMRKSAISDQKINMVFLEFCFLHSLLLHWNVIVLFCDVLIDFKFFSSGHRWYLVGVNMTMP